MKVRLLIRLLEQNGWTLSRQRGDHRQFSHLHIPGCVTVSGNLGHDVPKGTLASVLRQSGLKGAAA